MEKEELVASLKLIPHPEGGYYAETYRAPLRVSAHGRSRSVCTGIYYLLDQGDFSAFHRIGSDEMWHHYEGGAVLIHCLSKDQGYRLLKLGKNLASGEEPQRLAPAGTWFAAEPAVGAEFSLCGCTVAPGFEFADFELAVRVSLIEDFPDHSDIIHRLTRVEPAQGTNGK